MSFIRFSRNKFLSRLCGGECQWRAVDICGGFLSRLCGGEYCRRAVSCNWAGVLVWAELFKRKTKNRQIRRFFYGVNIMSSYVSQIQTKLKAFGLYAGEIDGIAGKMTVDAVAKALERGICTSKEHDDVAVINHSDPTVDENINKTLEPLPNCSGFSLSANSMDKLKGVNPALVKVVKRAIQISKQDFAVNEGLRTIERQRQLVKSGASQTMNSRHIGGFAVDLVPIVNGKVSWDWRYFYAIAEAVQAAANELGINVRWGGCWEVINNKSGTAKSWVDSYGAERQKLGKKAFTDGPHFELPD